MATKLIVKKPFSWAHRHVDVKEYAKGDTIETDDQDLIDVSTQEGWAKAETTAPTSNAPASAAADAA